MKYKKTLKILCALLFSLYLFVGIIIAANTTPSNFIYEGKLLNSTGTPISTTQSVRFSLWSSSDYITSDVVGGVINVGAVTYGGWQEAQNFTPSDNGTFSINLGEISPLPDINYSIHKFLQIEIKPVSSPDTSYELLDPTVDNGVDTNDRQIIGSLPYAKNADMLDNAIDANITSSGNVDLIFGDLLLNQVLQWNPDGVAINDGWFNFTDDVNIQGNLTVNGVPITGGGSFTGITVATTDGIFSSGGKIGYEAGNDMCKVDYGSSHMCTTDEIANTIATTTDLTTIFTIFEQGWIFEGAPGFTSNSNDCNGWTRNDNVDYFGAFWAFDPVGGGKGWLAPCNVTKPVACCQ